MWIGAGSVSVKKFNFKQILRRWFRSGKSHIRGHKSKNRDQIQPI